MDWVNGFIVPLIEIIFLGGLLGWISFIVAKALHNGISKSGKFIWKYKIKKKNYPEKIVKWIFECIENDIDWYGVKKILMVAGKPTSMINETLWIYNQILQEINKEKGGVKNGRKHKRDHSKNENKQTDFPSIKAKKT